MGNHPSLPPEGAFESSSASSPVDREQQDSTQLDSDVSQGFSNSMSAIGSEHNATTQSTPTPSANENQYNNDNSATVLDNLEESLFERPINSSCVSFDATEHSNLLELSFDSSNSSIINISEQSSEPIPEVSEQPTLSSEALILESIDQMQVLLKGVGFESGNSQGISDKTLESLEELHQTIGVLVSHCHTFQHNSESEGSTINQINLSSTSVNSSSIFIVPREVKDCHTSGNLNATYTGELHKESVLTKGTTGDSSTSVQSIQEEVSLDILNSAFCICDTSAMLTSMESTADKEHQSSSETHSAVVSTAALHVSGNKSVDNLSTSVQADQIQLESKDTENECMSVAEKLSVEPFLLKSLSALHTTTGADSLLTDAETCTGTFRPLYTGPQQLMCDVNKLSKSNPKEKISTVGLNPNDLQCKEETTLELPSVKSLIGLNEIIDHENYASTLGKAVIRNALAFEKYAVLFRQALNDDVVTASIGRALCKNALLFESLTDLANSDEQCQSKECHQVTNPTVEELNGKNEGHVFTSIPLCGDKNKENENPQVEHLFKQTATKRKLGTLEEETLRTKCLVLSQKTSVEKSASHNTHGEHRAKPGMKAKTYNHNDSTLNAGISKPKNITKKETLREIINNGPKKETGKQEHLFQNADKLECDNKLKHNKTNKERWTVIEKNNEDMLELEDSEDENSISLSELPVNFRTKLKELPSPQRNTSEDKSGQIVTLSREGTECRSKQLDALTGVYYFANQYIFCSICDTNIFNHLRVLDHINGSVHERNLMNRRNAAASIVSVSAMLQSIWDQIDVSLGRKLFCKLVKFENDMLACTLCDLQITGCLNVIAHISGKEHQVNVLDKIFSTTVQNISKEEHPNAMRRQISWPDGLSHGSSDVSLSESEGSIVEWLPTSSPTRLTTSESDLSGIYYFAKNYVFCSICNVNMFNSSIVLGHLHAKSHQANTLLQKQIESNQVFDYETKIKRIWNQIERTLGGTLFRTVLCVDKKANFFCDLCNMQIIIPGHLNILDHVCGKKHNKAFLKRILLPSSK